MQSQHLGLRLLDLLQAERGADPGMNSLMHLFIEVVNSIREIQEMMVADQEERYR